METVKISLAQLLLCSSQELVLIHKHGQQDEPEDNEYAFRQQWYRAMPGLTDREVRFTFSIDFRGRRFELGVCRFYHHNGELYRLTLVDQDGARVRRNGPKQREVNLLAVVGYLCGKYYRTAPKALNYLMYVRGNSDEVPIQRIESFSIEMPTDSEVEAFLRERLVSLCDALDNPKSAERCDIDQQHTVGPDARGCLSAPMPFRLQTAPPIRHGAGVPRKCIDWCPVRHQCRQRADYLTASASVLTGVELR